MKKWFLLIILGAILAVIQTSSAAELQFGLRFINALTAPLQLQKEVCGTFSPNAPKFNRWCGKTSLSVGEFKTIYDSQAQKIAESLNYAYKSASNWEGGEIPVFVQRNYLDNILITTVITSLSGVNGVHFAIGTSDDKPDRVQNENTTTPSTPLSNTNFSAPQGTTGAWEFSTKTDLLTDVKKSYLTLQTPDKDALVTARCTNKVLDIYVATDVFLNSKDPVPVLYRFDKNPVVQAGKWDISTNGKAVFVSDNLLTNFLMQALVAKSFVIRMTKYDGVDLTYQFNWTGFDVASKQLSCITQWLPKPEVTVLEYGCDPTSYGHTRVHGILKNTSDHRLLGLRYNVEFFDGTTSVATKHGITNPLRLEPGATAEFEGEAVTPAFTRCDLSIEDAKGKLITNLP